jgi:hypothetical protein
MLPYIGMESTLTDEQKADALIAGLKADRTWKRLYRERKAAVEEFLGERLLTLKEDVAALPAAYSSKKDLLVVGEALTALVTAVAQSKKNDDIVENVKAQGDEAALATFESFCSDLLLDLENSRKAVLEAHNTIESEVHLGRVYSALIEEVVHYKASVSFVSLMSEKLRESAPKQAE